MNNKHGPIRKRRETYFDYDGADFCIEYSLDKDKTVDEQSSVLMFVFINDDWVQLKTVEDELLKTAIDAIYEEMGGSSELQ